MPAPASAVRFPLSLSDSLPPPLSLSFPSFSLCAVLTWHKNAKIIYLPCLQFRAVFTPRRHVDTAPIRHTMRGWLRKSSREGGTGGVEWQAFAEEAFGRVMVTPKYFSYYAAPAFSLPCAV